MPVVAGVESLRANPFCRLGSSGTCSGARQPPHGVQKELLPSPIAWRMLTICSSLSPTVQKPSHEVIGNSILVSQDWVRVVCLSLHKLTTCPEWSQSLLENSWDGLAPAYRDEGTEQKISFLYVVALCCVRAPPQTGLLHVIGGLQCGENWPSTKQEKNKNDLMDIYLTK